MPVTTEAPTGADASRIPGGAREFRAPRRSAQGRRGLTAALVVAAGPAPLGWAAQAQAEVDPSRAEALGQLEGLDLGLAYTAEAFQVVDGDDAWHGLLEARADADLDRLLDLEGWSASATFLASHGDRLTEEVGDFQVASNIEAPEAARLYEIWIQSADVQRGWSLRAGVYDITSEFDVMPSGQLFVQSSHGTGAIFASSGLNGPSTYPISALGARFELDLGDDAFARLAVGDGVPGDPLDETSNQTELSSREGAVIVAEVGRETETTKWALGAWGYTTTFEVATDDGLGLRDSQGSQGAYAFLDRALLSEPARPRATSAFLRLGYADERNTTLDRYVGVGLVERGVLPDRDDDSLGLAVAAARFVDSGRWETALELTYRCEPRPWLALQPDVQLVLDPGGRGRDALLFGMRVTVAL